MATGQSLYSDISSLVNTIREGALFTLRQQNLLVPTVSVFRDTMGMNPRNVSRYGTANVRSLGEGDDVTPTQFSRTSLTTLTPARYADQFFISDQRVMSDDQTVRADAALELGAAFAQDVDVNIATNFGSLTAGTVGSAGSALTWSNIMSARAILQAKKVPGPYYCALHPYGWLDLVNAATTSGNAIMDAPNFRDSMVNSYFVSTIIGGVTFVVTPSIAIDGSDDATGAMYAPLAIAYDERRAFNIRPERDESREGIELNASLWYAHGVWDATRGVQIIHDAATPS